MLTVNYCSTTSFSSEINTLSLSENPIILHRNHIILHRNPIILHRNPIMSCSESQPDKFQKCIYLCICLWFLTPGELGFKFNPLGL